MNKPTAFCNRCGNNKYLFDTKGRFSVAVQCPDCFLGCAKCKGRGYTVVDRDGYDYIQTCECQTVPTRISLFNRAQIPAHYHSKLFLPFKNESNYKVHSSQERAQMRVWDWGKAFIPGARGFLLVGPCGTGKTLLLCQALRHLTLRLGYFCRYVEFATLLDEMKEKISERRDGSAQESIKGPLKDATVLVIDELGKGRRTEWEMSELDTLISERYQAGKTTLFATNYLDGGQVVYHDAPKEKAPLFGEGAKNMTEQESLAQRVGARIYSRLREFCEFIKVEGDDYRLREGKKGT